MVKINESVNKNNAIVFHEAYMKTASAVVELNANMLKRC